MKAFLAIIPPSSTAPFSHSQHQPDSADLFPATLILTMPFMLLLGVFLRQKYRVSMFRRQVRKLEKLWQMEVAKK